jgi:hypothetical protein
MRIAARTSQPVLTTTSETEITETVTDADLTRVDRSGADSAVSLEARTETAPPVTPEPEQPQATETPQATSDPAPDLNGDPERTDLPSTASLLPLLAVIGIGSLVGSRWLRRSRRV